jgi:hypothetical protein
MALPTVPALTSTNPAMRGRIGTVPVDLDADPGQAIGLCRAAHARLMATGAEVTDPW